MTTPSEFWENLANETYYREVLGNMLGPSRGATVRFGKLGGGVAPNYQVLYNDGGRRTFRGLTHRSDAGLVSEFADSNLSRSYTYQEVQQFLQRVISHAGGNATA